MNPELHATVGAWPSSSGWEDDGQGRDPVAEAEEARSVTPDLVAHFESTIEELRSEIAALRTALEEQRIAAEQKQARMVTLNMALNGAPREEAELYLSQNFRLAEAGPILDDAYGRDAS